MAKNLMINCASCDARNVREETYAEYEKISINCSTLLTNPEAKTIMSKLPFEINCASLLDLPEGVELRSINGRAEIKSSDVPAAAPYFLLVNGSLDIGSDTQRQLESCVGMRINGSLNCPRSLYSSLKDVHVNGSVNVYPDGAILLKRSAVIDKTFVLRAKKALYWSAKRMIIVDPELDVEKLRDKGARFSSKEIILPQSKAEALLDLIDEKSDIIIVPDGCAVILDDLDLDEMALRRYGKKLYIIGDVSIHGDPEVLDEISYLTIRGDARVTPELKEKFLEKLSGISGEIKEFKAKGSYLTDKVLVKINKWILDQHPKGIEVSDCAVVKIAKDVPQELIAERLHIEDCAVVKCSPEQEAAVSLISEDIGKISTKDEKDDGQSLGEKPMSELGGIKGLLDTKVINAANYAL